MITFNNMVAKEVLGWKTLQDVPDFAYDWNAAALLVRHMIDRGGEFFLQVNKNDFKLQLDNGEQEIAGGEDGNFTPLNLAIVALVMKGIQEEDIIDAIDADMEDE